MAPSNTQTEINNIAQCLDALHNALRNNAGFESLCKGKFRLLTRYLMCPYFEVPTLNVLTVLMANQECIADIVGMGIVPALLVVSANANPSNTAVILAALVCLNMVVSHPQVVKEALQKGNFSLFLSSLC